MSQRLRSNDSLTPAFENLNCGRVLTNVETVEIGQRKSTYIERGLIERDVLILEVDCIILFDLRKRSKLVMSAFEMLACHRKSLLYNPALFDSVQMGALFLK